MKMLNYFKCEMNTLWPDSACQTCIRPSVDPLNTNWESGLKDASSGIFLSFR